MLLLPSSPLGVIYVLSMFLCVSVCLWLRCFLAAKEESEEEIEGGEEEGREEFFFVLTQNPKYIVR